MSGTRLRPRLLQLLRLTLCVAALTYVFWQTDLHDSVRLAEDGKLVLLVGIEGNSAEIIQDNQQRTISVDSLQKTQDGSVHVQAGLLGVWRGSNKYLLLLAIAIYGLQPSLQIVRFKWMLNLQEVRIGWLDAAAVCLVGNFYNYVIPGTTGGDVVRIGYLVRNKTHPHGVVVATGLDRLTGLAGMLALAAVVGLGWPAQPPIVRHVGLLSALLLVGLVVGFIAVTGWQRLSDFLRRLPLGDHLRRLYEAAGQGKRGWATLLAAVGLTVVLQSGTMSAFSVAAVALGMQPVWQHYFVCLPISLVVAAVPIVPMGLGTLEATMVLLLAGQAGSVSQVLALAISMRLIGLLWALPGGALPMWWSGRGSRGPSDR